MIRPKIWAVIVGTAAVASVVTLVRRSRRVATGRSVSGGLLMGDPAGYDVLSRFLFGSLFRGIAADVAAAAPSGATVLEIGCGPGLLSIRLARSHGLELTGLDLDPAMIERARANADRAPAGQGPSPSFVAGDVAALPFDDGSFDLVVSTFSMHHWADRTAGLAEIARVLRPGGRALIWDLNPGGAPFHRKLPGHQDHDTVAALRQVSVRPWHWPAHLTLARRIEFVRA